MKTIAFLLAISTMATCQTWRLDEPKTVPPTTRDYSLTIEYSFSNTEGQIVRKEQVSGTYTLTMPGGLGVWKEVSIRSGPDAVVNLEYMKGVRCGIPNFADTLKPEFFRNFPPQAFEARNMVWDAVMFLGFANTRFSLLKLNQPVALAQDQQMDLAGTGTFNNKNLQLTWSGYSERNGERCALIDYHAYFNPLTVDQPGVKMKGRSHYWGQIWISLASRQIEYGTLYEDVLLETTPPVQGIPPITNVFRSGIFEPIKLR